MLRLADGRDADAWRQDARTLGDYIHKMLQKYYDSQVFDPSTATGARLDAICELSGTFRRKP